MKINRIFFIILLVAAGNLTRVSGYAETDRSLDRAAMERVYHDHRTGTQQSFEETMPESLIRQLVEKDLKKENVLKSLYGISITESQIQAEVNRINTSTRAPEMLEEIKAALGHDPKRFADTVVKPIIVDRILRNKYNNDNSRHKEQRGTAEKIRSLLISLKSSGVEHQQSELNNPDYQSNTIKWILAPRPEEEIKPPSPIQSNTPVEGTASGGRYSIESTVQIAQVISSPDTDSEPDEPEFYFEDLHPELQRVLNVQLQNSGDASAVIERPTGFQIFLLISRTAEKMEVDSITIPKRSYDEWLAAQPN